MPDEPSAANLAPVFSPPIPTRRRQAADGALHLPKNFHLEVYASGMANARSLRDRRQGHRLCQYPPHDKIFAVVDRNGKHEIKTIASGLKFPNGIAFHDGTLYIAELNRISKIDQVERPSRQRTEAYVIYSDLPSYEPHGWKFLTVGPDNKLYFNVGAPCNICMPPPTNAQLRRINLDGSGMN